MAKKNTVIKALDKLPKKVERWVSDAAEQAMRDVAQEAKATTVFKDRTGDHRRSIQSELDREVGTSVKAVLRAGMEYSMFLELGTRRMSPRAHLWPAMIDVLVSKEQFTNNLKSTFDYYLG